MCTQTKICIYCGQNDPTKFKGVEHVVPQAFGTFGSETPTLDCVCDDCNGYFGKKHDLYLARETVEGVVRYKKGIFSSAARPQKHLHITLENTPENGQFAGMKVAIDGTTGELLELKAQFQVLNHKTGKKETYFKHDLVNLQLPEDVYGRPGSNGVKGTWVCNIFAPSKAEHDEIVDILHANGIAFGSGEPFLLPKLIPDDDGKHTLPLSIEAEIGIEHRQAHAKIFLNFIAKYLGRDEAIKADWDFLRHYARFGKGAIKYRVAEHPLLPPAKDEELRRLIGEGIVIQIQNMGGHVVGAIRFYGNQTYQYILHENASIPDEHEFGFMFTDGKEPAMLITGKNLSRWIKQYRGD
jgi:hypothetical protein